MMLLDNIGYHCEVDGGDENTTNKSTCDEVAVRDSREVPSKRALLDDIGCESL